MRARPRIRAWTPAPRAVFACVLAALLTAWWGSVAEAKRPPVRIGALHNLSGPLGSIGRPSLAGARLAVEQLNAGGGLLARRVKLVARDGRSDPAVVRAKARQLVRTPHVTAITGLNDTAMALAAARVAEQAHTVLLTSGATSPLVPIQFRGYYFMACFGDNTQAAAGAEFAYRRLGGRTAWLLLDDTTDFTRLLARYFRERYLALGGDILGEDTYAGGTPDFSAQIARIRALPAPPDLLYVASGPDDSGRLVKQLRDAGVDEPIVSGDGYDTPLLLQDAGAAAHDVYFTTHAFLTPNTGTPRQRRFVADYQAAYGVAPKTAFAALGYDAVMLVADAIKRAGSAKRTAIPAALEATSAFPAVTGAISFAPGLHIPEKEVTVVKADGKGLALEAVLRPDSVPAP